jgi:hypothetical protein
VLAAKEAFDSPADLVDVLRYCAVVSVRFNGVGRRSTHILEEVYNRAALEVQRAAKPTLAAVRQALRPIYIPDDEFQADFAALRLRSRGISGKRLRYLLAGIEAQLSGADISDEAMSATVEHILPENPGDEGWEHFSSEARERSCNRLGNYALLERKANIQEAANAPFEIKQAVYEQSRYQTSRELDQFSEWTEGTIAKRQAKMARVAKTVWSLEV